MTEETRIVDQVTPRYFAMIPYMIDDMGLSVFAVRLYLRILRRAGNDGYCWENTRNLAAGCNMSLGMVSAAKKELEQNGLITVSLKTKDHGEFPYHEITINNIWKQNIEKYSTCSPHEQDPFTERDRTCSPGEPKENPLKDKAGETKKTRRARHTTPKNFSKSEKFFGGTNSIDTTLFDPNILLIKEVTGYFPRTRVSRKNIIEKCKNELGEGILLNKERLERVFVNWVSGGSTHDPQNLHAWFYERYWEDEYYTPDYQKKAMPKENNPLY